MKYVINYRVSFVILFLTHYTAGTMAQHTVLVLLLCYCVLCSESKSIPSISFQFPEQWQAWKTAYFKNYTSQVEELDRHLVWLSNKKYIESHNANSHIFGYTLELNKFADMVRLCMLLTLVAHAQGGYLVPVCMFVCLFVHIFSRITGYKTAYERY